MKKYNQPPLKKQNLYGNCVMLSPDGIIMCRCDEDKAQWYLSRGLAKIVVTHPIVFQLTFKPKNTGHAGTDKYSAFFLSEKENKCCVCGAEEHLTRHHCVPIMYRRYFCDEMKNHNMHDIFMLCSECHWKYERAADKLKEEIAKETGIPISGGSKKEPPRTSNKIGGLMMAITKYGNKIPKQRLSEMKKKVNELAGRKISPSRYSSFLTTRREDSVRSTRQVAKKIGINEKNHGELVLAEIKDHAEFVRRWRRHFVQSMKPKYMPNYWNIDNPVMR